MLSNKPSVGKPIVVAGVINLDIIPDMYGVAGEFKDLIYPGKMIQVGRAILATGGAVSNVGLALCRLGFPVRLIGKVGDDDFGKIILSLIQSQSPNLVEGMIIAPGEYSSYTFVINLPGVDRFFIHSPGANNSFCAEDIRTEDLSGGSIFHFGYPTVMRRMYRDAGIELADLLRKVNEAGLSTSLDLSMPDPNTEAGQADWHAILANVLPYVDFFFPSLEELLFILDRPTYQRVFIALEQNITAIPTSVLEEFSSHLLEMGVAVVAFKLGDQGIYVRTTQKQDKIEPLCQRLGLPAENWMGRTLLAPCFKVNVAGTTGAGDCTVAGFLAGVSLHLNLEDVMVGAVGVGACNVEALDATSGIRPWKDVMDRIHNGWERLTVNIELTGWEWIEKPGIWFMPGPLS